MLKQNDVTLSNHVLPSVLFGDFNFFIASSTFYPSLKNSFVSALKNFIYFQIIIFNLY